MNWLSAGLPEMLTTELAAGEQLRTFRGRLFRTARHLERLRHSTRPGREFAGQVVSRHHGARRHAALRTDDGRGPEQVSQRPERFDGARLRRAGDGLSGQSIGRSPRIGTRCRT